MGTERLVAMLIRVSNPTDRSDPSGVQQASANERPEDGDRAMQAGGVAGQDEAGSAPQPTYGAHSRRVRRPVFWRLRNREHSILVDRLHLLPRANRN